MWRVHVKLLFLWLLAGILLSLFLFSSSSKRFEQLLERGDKERGLETWQIRLKLIILVYDKMTWNIKNLLTNKAKFCGSLICLTFYLTHFLSHSLSIYLSHFLPMYVTNRNLQLKCCQFLKKCLHFCMLFRKLARMQAWSTPVECEKHKHTQVYTYTSTQVDK